MKVCKSVVAVALLALVVGMSGLCFAHGQRLAVVVDSDAGADDARALALLAASEHVRLLAVVSSDGVCPPQEGARHLVGLLSFLNLEGVKVGVGAAVAGPSPACRTGCRAGFWTKLGSASVEGLPPAQRVLAEVLAAAPGPVSYLCLGPMTNLAKLVTSRPGLKAKIGCVLYYGTPPGLTPTDFNTRRDSAAARIVFGSGLKVVCFRNRQTIYLGSEILAGASATRSAAGRLVQLQASDPMLSAHFRGQGLPMWDDLVALWLEAPFVAEGVSDKGIVERFDPARVRAQYLRLVGGGDKGLSPRPLVLLAGWPLSPRLYQPDVAPWVPRLVARHGLDEFAAGVLSTELHRHMGIISILGVKMGMRARELLGAGLGELKVVSYAGTRPPTSCLNDGLQAATGASLGRGGIRVEKEGRIAADFCKGSKRLRLELTPELRLRLKQEIVRLRSRFGPLTPAYFHGLRAVALRWWFEIERAKAFSEHWLESRGDTGE